jgi:hypothetical protein
MDVAICTGRSCRKRDGAAALRDAVAGSGRVVDSSCLSICKGPVVVLDPLGDVPLVLSKVRSRKAIRDVGRVVAGRPPSRRLRERTVTGSKRDKAVHRAIRALRRR